MGDPYAFVWWEMRAVILLMRVSLEGLCKGSKLPVKVVWEYIIMRRFYEYQAFFVWNESWHPHSDSSSFTILPLPKI